jgi:hypothetical protein
MGIGLAQASSSQEKQVPLPASAPPESRRDLYSFKRLQRAGSLRPGTHAARRELDRKHRAAPQHAADLQLRAVALARA